MWTLSNCTERSTFYALKADLQTHAWVDKVLTDKPACDCTTQRHAAFDAVGWWTDSQGFCLSLCISGSFSILLHFQLDLQYTTHLHARSVFVVHVLSDGVFNNACECWVFVSRRCLWGHLQHALVCGFVHLLLCIYMCCTVCLYFWEDQSSMLAAQQEGPLFDACNILRLCREKNTFFTEVEVQILM